jgi:hypothetical protein
MAISKIDGICLYTGIDWENPTDHSVEFDCLQYFKDNGITQFDHLNYYIDHQAECLASLRNWIFKDGLHPEIQAYPFVIYTECDYSTPMSSWPKVLIYGADAINAAGLPDLYKIGR